MPATDLQGSSSPLTSIGRSILTLRRDHAPAMDGAADRHPDPFQQRVADIFHSLASESDDLLSISWVRRLLDMFLIVHDEFHSILASNGPSTRRPPLDRMLAEFLDQSVKALDVCNAIRDGIENVRRLGGHVDIALAALGARGPPLGEAQLRRARKALTDLTIAMLDEKEASSVIAHRNRSFGRPSGSGKDRHAHFRSLSWSVSRSWSAARQLQAIGSNLSAPRSSEVIATGGLAVTVFTMRCILLFVMWALVAAIPCQDRGLQTHFPILRGFTWAAPVLALHDRIVEEARRRERRGSNGLLREIHGIEKGARNLMEVIEGAQLPLGEEREGEVRARVGELSGVCEAMKVGLEPLERQVREVFRRIVRSRTERLDGLEQTS